MKRLSLALLLAILLVPFSCGNDKVETGPLQPIVILYENDVHCAIDGYAKLAGLRNTLNDSNYVAVVSAGDYLQGGTAGALSFGAHIMDIQTAVGYDAMTLGNHEFDNGQEDLARRLKNCRHKTVTCNYDFTGTPLEKLVKPYVIVRRGGMKIGIVGATCYLEGVVLKSAMEGLRRLNAIEEVNR